MKIPEADQCDQHSFFVEYENKKSDAWENTSKNLLAHKPEPNHCKLDLQPIYLHHRVYCTPKFDFDKDCTPIYTHFVNWHYADE